MAAKLASALRAAPVTMPALAAIALFVAWAGNQAGYPVTHWAPGGLILLVLLALALLLAPPRPRELPLPVRVALAALAAYTALSFLSILWAHVPDDAWQGANRTLLYLLVFALFAGWHQRGVSAALLLCTWIAAVSVLALVVLAHIDGASRSQLASLIPTGRLTSPSGYANANAAQWLMAAWPAAILCADRALAWPLRGLLAGAAVLLAEVALLSQSRGSLYATPIMFVLVFALLPRRARAFAAFVPIVAGVAAGAPAVLRVGNHLRGGVVIAGNVHAAVTATLVSAAVVAIVVSAAAAVERRLALREGTTRRIRRGVGAAGIATLIVIIAGGLVAAGDPVTRVRHAWDTFKSPRGYLANAPGSRLVSGLGSQRYDVYRVALDEFLAHPLVGIGADNYAQQYLRHGRTNLTPRYPHSVEMRTLAETGIVGVLIAVAGLAAALLAALRAAHARRRGEADPLRAAVAAAALGGFLYWLVHGSVDWFYEFAGLGAPAFALLGLCCALHPRATAAGAQARASGAQARAAGAQARAAAAKPPWSPLLGRAGIAAAALAALAAAASFAAPWLSGLEIDSAAHIWPGAPLQAYQRLADASDLDPLSDQAQLLAGSIALRFGDLARARREFTHALQRVGEDAYATLELGAIASTEGRAGEALPLLTRAQRLQPRDTLTQEALRLARSHRRVNVDELNRAILLKAEELR